MVSKELRKQIVCRFRYTLYIKDNQFMDSVMKEIYPKDLSLTSDNVVLKAHYLDLDLDIVHDNAFGFSIVIVS